MQIQVHHVEPHVPRAGDAQDGVHVGAVVIQQAARFMHHVRDFSDIGIKQPQRIGVGQHESGHLFIQQPGQSLQIHEPAFVRRHADHLEPGHRRGCGIGAVGGVGNNDAPAPRIVPMLVPRLDNHQPGHLTVRAGGRLQAHPVHPGHFAKHPAGLVQQR
ncbi:hypothetical protein SDC9_172119 [bioreactor metagenome]|uniref:Uncharacterized protein n=1 Tax=bioreactor metagenome TaxID=1076179 RepID=A0A645GCU2_9ZZZZ